MTQLKDLPRAADGDALPRNPIVRLGQDEEGSVVILTVILMMLLVKVSFSTFNVGVLTAERTRLQMVSDTAAYSSAVWQARFLNYCAYTQRAIIANYANVSLYTAIETNKQSWDHYKDYDPFTIPGCFFDFDIEEDESILRMIMNILDPIYDFSHGQLAADESARTTAEALSRIYSESQDTLYSYVKRPWLTVVPTVYKAANAANPELAPITDNLGYVAWAEQGLSSEREGLLNDSMIEQKDLRELQDEIELRFDRFTQPGEGLFGLGQPLNALPFVASRPYWGISPPAGCETCSILCISPKPRVVFYQSRSEELELNLDSDYVYTSDYTRPLAFGIYELGCQFIPCLTGCCELGPFFGPILDNNDWYAAGSNDRYNFKQQHEDIKFFDMKTTTLEHLEPSVYVALSIDRDEFVGPQGRLFNNIGIPLGSQVRDLVAVSRAKVLFQPRHSDTDTTFYRPNLYYPYWEAQLAPYYGSGYDDTHSTLKDNGRDLLLAAFASDLALTQIFNTTRISRGMHY